MKDLIDKLPLNFRLEEKDLTFAGIKTWSALKCLSQKDLIEISSKGSSNIRSLKRLKVMAIFICDLNISQPQAALIIHSGFSTINSLANATPQEIIQKTGRLERQLRIDQSQIVNLASANNLIRKAKEITFEQKINQI
mgnify:CR=1 FL=1|tara:strand:+ start:177 stop:590 length:414 start_codon:yes stop_codon:yes gene_type:complete